MADQKAVKPKLVIDANVIIKNPNLHELMLSYELFTVPAVVGEIKDPVARARFATVANQLKIESPDKKSCDMIAQFARKTGDFISLSTADFQVIALGYQKIVEMGKIDQINTEPRKPSNYKKVTPGDGTEAGEESDEGSEEGIEEESEEDMDHQQNHNQGGSDHLRNIDEQSNLPAGAEPSDKQNNETENEDEGATNDDEWISVVKSKKEVNRPHQKHHAIDNKSEISKESETISSNMFTKSITTDRSEDKEHPQLWYQNKDFAPEDEEGWINPSNLNNVMHGTRVGESEALAELGVGIMTADFAMQVFKCLNPRT